METPTHALQEAALDKGELIPVFVPSHYLATLATGSHFCNMRQVSCCKSMWPGYCFRVNLNVVMCLHKEKAGNAMRLLISCCKSMWLGYCFRLTLNVVVCLYKEKAGNAMRLLINQKLDFALVYISLNVVQFFSFHSKRDTNSTSTLPISPIFSWFYRVRTHSSAWNISPTLHQPP